MKDRLIEIYGVRYKVQLHGIIDGKYLSYNLKDTQISPCFYATLENFGDNKFYFLLDNGAMVIIPYKDVMFMAPTVKQEENNG